MANQVEVRDVERWLKKNGFEKLPGKASGHMQYSNGTHKIPLPGHGPKDLTKKHVAGLLKLLAAAGFDPAIVREELDGI